MRLLSSRLSFLLFLLFAVPGAWVPVISRHLQMLGFSPLETGIVCATSALGAILGPLVWGQIADRWLASERCIGFCSGVAGLMLWLAAEATEPTPMFLFCLGHWIFYVPVFSLATSMAFRHLTEPEGTYGPIRMWGTVGWVLASWLLGAWLFAEAEDSPGRFSDLSVCLRLGGMLAWILSVYSWTLPATPPNPTLGHHSWWRAMIDAPLHAAALLRRSEIALLALCLFGMYVTMPFSGQMAPLLLNHLGVSDAWLPIALTLAQSTEVVTLFFLPRCLRRWGEKRALLVGLVAWGVAMAVLAVGQPAWLVIGSLALHGVCICFFFVVAQLAVNRRASGHFRASAQSLLAWLGGIGLLVGHLTAGSLRQHVRAPFAVGFGAAAILVVILALVLMMGFDSTSSKQRPTLSEPLQGT